MRVLVADDDRASRLIAEAALRRLGHDCETVSDGTEAWQAFSSRPPDVVISDRAMPGLNGLELCRKIRAHTAERYTYGGEELLCILPEQSPAGATVAAERMRRGVEELAINHAGNDGGVLTLSGGVAMLDAGDTRSADEVLKEADESLCRAKRLGRNRVGYSAAGAPQPVL